MKLYAAALFTFVSLIGDANAVVGNPPIQAHVPAAPRISCQISVPAWCITIGVEKIEMADEAHRRTWALSDRIYTKDAPLLVVENEANCSASQSSVVRKLYERTEGHYLVIAYSLSNEDGCFLEFRLPMKDGKVDIAYRQMMLYAIMIGGKQLYTYDQP